MQAFQFTADDLTHNKQGKFSARQAAAMKSNNRIGALLMFIFLILSAVFGFIVARPILFGQVGLFDDIFRLIGGGFLAFLTLFFLWHFLRFVLRTGKPSITKFEGTVERVFSRQEEDKNAEFGGMITVHLIAIAGREIYIQQRQMSAFHQGHRYALYVDKLFGILSVEYLGGPLEV